MTGYSLGPLDYVSCFLSAAFKRAVIIKDVPQTVRIDHDLCVGSYIRSNSSVIIDGKGDLSVDRSVVKSGGRVFARADISQGHFVSGEEMIVHSHLVKGSTFVGFNGITAVSSDVVEGFRLIGGASTVLISSSRMNDVEVVSEGGSVICDMRYVDDPVFDIESLRVFSDGAVVVIADQDMDLTYNDWRKVLGLPNDYGGLLVMKEGFFNNVGGFPKGREVASAVGVHKVMVGLDQYYRSLA